MANTHQPATQVGNSERVHVAPKVPGKKESAKARVARAKYEAASKQRGTVADLMESAE